MNKEPEKKNEDQENKNTQIDLYSKQISKDVHDKDKY